MDQRFEERLERIGITDLTPIQKATEEPMATGQSIDALAPTGTGKTLAFTWPILPLLTPLDGEQLLILAPSQELAMQTTRVIREWATLLGLKVTAVTGGANVKNQLAALKKHPEIIVGTPGRTAELVKSGKLKLQRLRTLIIDEADDLLIDDTANQIDQIWHAVGDDSVQVALFGATAVDSSIAAGLFEREFERIDQRNVPIPSSIKHEFWPTARDQRNKRLRQLAARKDFQAMVFFNTTKQLKITASYLAHEHVAMATLVRGDSSSTRAKSLDNFRKGKAKFLLTTDVAARGLDIPHLPAVINFDLPREGETYTHRSGRTGRMGRTGLVISFGNDHDLRDLRHLVAVDIVLVNGAVSATKMSNKVAREGGSQSVQQITKPVKKIKSMVEKNDSKSLPKKAKEKAPEIVSRAERFAKEKKAKRKHVKNKGKRQK